MLNIINVLLYAYCYIKHFYAISSTYFAGKQMIKYFNVLLLQRNNNRSKRSLPFVSEYRMLQVIVNENIPY